MGEGVPSPKTIGNKRSAGSYRQNPWRVSKLTLCMDEKTLHRSLKLLTWVLSQEGCRVPKQKVSAASLGLPTLMQLTAGENEGRRNAAGGDGPVDGGEKQEAPGPGGKEEGRVGWCKWPLPDSVKGLLVALFGGGLPAGFVAPFTKIAYEASHIPSLEILLFRCIIHMALFFYIKFRGGSLFGPREAWRSTFVHAIINIVSIACAYSSFMVIPAGNAATVRKGTSTLCSALMALVIDSYHLSVYDWIGLLGSLVGLILIVVPDLLRLDRSSRLSDIFGYILAMLGGLALAMALMIFRTLTHPSKLMTAAFTFGMVGSLICAPLMLLLQKPIAPVEPLTWCCVTGITVLALVSFFCANYAVTKTHPALVCAFLHSEVVVTMTVQYFVLHEPISPFGLSGATVIICSIVVITAQNMAQDHKELNENK
ncbi:solute carrier family 35 member G3-like [Hemiscyllium ocellatum]|uniref:solute carrier family 35 member G3-like n=1 Tax=Hemiscyllium ocellatum TaxID=170820 RepID=UPI00296741B2|nr:solute carrier family 35 member G3-like [Hemiscyllium ocellatum]